MDEQRDISKTVRDSVVDGSLPGHFRQNSDYSSEEIVRQPTLPHNVDVKVNATPNFENGDEFIHNFLMGDDGHAK